MEKSICVFDLNGYSSPGHFPVSMWADLIDEVIKFGGDWEEIPDWKWDKKRIPTEEEILQYVKENS